MSATTEPSTDLLLALCCECGSTRTVSRRAAGRSLRCETCRKTTPHAAIGADRIGDWRESLDHRKKPNLSVDDKLDVLRALDVDVRTMTRMHKAAGVVAIAAVYWYMESDSEFLVKVNRGECSDAQLGPILTQILERVSAPEDERWFISRMDGELVANIMWP